MKVASAGSDIPRVPTGDIGELGVWEAIDVYDRELAASSVEELTGGGSAAYYLRRAALEAVIADRVRACGTINLLTGASIFQLCQITAARASRR